MKLRHNSPRPEIVRVSTLTLEAGGTGKQKKKKRSTEKPNPSCRLHRAARPVIPVCVDRSEGCMRGWRDCLVSYIRADDDGPRLSQVHPSYRSKSTSHRP